MKNVDIPIGWNPSWGPKVQREAPSTTKKIDAILRDVRGSFADCEARLQDRLNSFHNQIEISRERVEYAVNKAKSSETMIGRAESYRQSAVQTAREAYGAIDRINSTLRSVENRLLALENA